MWVVPLVMPVAVPQIILLNGMVLHGSPFIDSSTVNGMDNTVYALFYKDGTNTLFAGGAFVNAGSTLVNNITSWNGTNWVAFSQAPENAGGYQWIRRSICN